MTKSLLGILTTLAACWFNSSSAFQFGLRKRASSEATQLANRRVETMAMLSMDGQHDASGSSILCRLKTALADKSTELIKVEGYVKSKRCFGRSLIFVDLVTHQEFELCQALLRREYYSGTHYEGYRKCFHPGTLMEIQGVASPTRNPGEVVLTIHQIKLIQVPWQPQHVRVILALAVEGSLPVREVSEACLVPVEAIQDIAIDDCQKVRMLAKEVVSKMKPPPDQIELFLDSRTHQKRARLVSPPKKLSSPPTQVLRGKIGNLTLIEVESIQDLRQFYVHAPALVSVKGYIQNRRRFDCNITAVNLVDSWTQRAIRNDSDALLHGFDFGRLECILHPKVLETADMYGNLLTVGSRAFVTGFFFSLNEDSGQTLWVTEISLMQASWQPTTLQYALDLLNKGRLSVEEVSESMRLSFAETEMIAKIDDVTERQWKANEISVKLQSVASRMAKVSLSDLNTLNNFNHLRAKWPLLPPTNSNIETGDFLQNRSPGSKWERKKKPQLEWMVEEIAGVARSHVDYGRRELSILDVGGGKGHLANLLANQLGDSLKVHVIDISAGAVQNGAMRAQRLKLDVNYQVADASTVTLKDSIDIVVALHACGHLSDIALGHAVHHRAAFVICPCCFASNPHLRIPVSGEAVEDFLGISSCEWKALKSIAEVQGDSKLSSRAMHTICAIRAEALGQKTGLSIKVKSFPIQYSTRNICLVGRRRLF
jgi:2-polyprenyl-3-methyl-5-hydroxy-6-metoxy-1,4-benzoquinol methylase